MSLIYSRPRTGMNLDSFVPIETKLLGAGYRRFTILLLLSRQTGLTGLTLSFEGKRIERWGSNLVWRLISH